MTSPIAFASEVVRLTPSLASTKVVRYSSCAFSGEYLYFVEAAGIMPAAAVAGPWAAIPPLATERDVVGAVGCAVPSVFAFPVGVALEREMTLV